MVHAAMLASRARKRVIARKAVVGPCVAVNDPEAAGNRNSANVVRISTRANFGAEVNIRTSFYTEF